MLFGHDVWKLIVDEQLSKGDIFRLVNTFRRVNPNDSSAVEMLTIPVEASDDGAHVVLKQPDADSVLARLRSFGESTAKDTSKVLPAQIRVRVLNASGETGAAGRALAEFQRYSFAPAGVGKDLKAANRDGARYAVIIGPEEWTAKAVNLKNLGDGTERRVPLDDLPEALGSA